MTQDNLYIVIPAYNEEENIGSVIEDWYPVVKKIGGESRLVVISDGSRDRTYEILCEYRKKCPRLVCIEKRNEGHGPTLMRAYRYAIRKGADYIFQTDSDGQTLPSEFPMLWKDREKCGLLIGCRTHRMDGFSRVVVTRTLRMLLLLVFGIWVKDANTPFRLMKAKELSRVLKRIPSDYNLPNVLMTVIYEKHHLGVIYYPITFRPRQGGKNSLNMKRIFRIGVQAVKDFRILRRSI